jgi:hypothetical protein
MTLANIMNVTRLYMNIKEGPLKAAKAKGVSNEMKMGVR